MAERRHSTSNRRAFDRFIPYRPGLDVEASHARLSCSSVCSETSPNAGQYRNTYAKQYWKILRESIDMGDERILPITAGTPKRTSPFTNILNTLGARGAQSPDQGYYSPSRDTHNARNRRVTVSPECIMDMPGLRDDFYTNVLDWSHKNLIAVALGQTTYVWNAESKTCRRIQLYPGEPENIHATSLCWSPHSSLLAIAYNMGEITVCGEDKVLSPLSDSKKKSAVGALQWTDYGIISGNRKGVISLYDYPRTPIRCRNMSLQLPLKHRKEVCGLRHSPGTPYLASGSEDGRVNIWDLRMAKHCRTIQAHSACTKALSWCPWRPSILATGGGASDGHIRLWHIHTGNQEGEIFTKSQVCGLLWSREYMELVSAHGSTTPENNDVIVWSMRNFEFDPLTRLRQHLARPLHLALSPDQTTIASAGADEALCLWKIFPKKKKTPSTSSWDRSPLNLFNAIR